MIRQSQTAQVVGRSMEPALFEGDLVELTAESARDAKVGHIYGFFQPGLNRMTTHRLQATGGQFVFRGDRQPKSETAESTEPLFELTRILERRVKPDAAAVMFGLLLLTDRPPCRFPKHATISWPWEELLYLGQKHRVNAALVYSLKRHGLWGEAGAHQEKFASAWNESLQRAPLIETAIQAVKTLLPAGAFLKGAVLRELYPAPLLRTMEDVDYLVPAQDFYSAIEVLCANGFSQTADAKRVAGFYSSTTLTHTETGIPIDLHRAPFQPSRFSFSADEFLRPLSPELHFVYLAAHAFQHWGRHGQCLLDLWYLTKKHSLDFPRAAELAKARGALSSFLFACEQLHLWLNHPTPELPKAPLGIRLRLALANELHAHRLQDGVFGKRKLLLQLLLSDSFSTFWRLYRDPARRLMR